MKIYVKASFEKQAKHKRKNIPREEYNDAIQVGKRVLSELHRRYPEEFPASSRSIHRSTAWSDVLYVTIRLNIPIKRQEGDPTGYEYSWKITKEIRDSILPELGISYDDDFDVSLSNVDGGNRGGYSIMVFDRNKSAWE